MRTALRALLEARHFASDLRCDIWQFAVEANVLQALGVTPNDLRWLLGRQYVEFAEETTHSSSDRREFSACPARNLAGAAYNNHSCFVLTDSGLASARSLVRRPTEPMVDAEPRFHRVHDASAQPPRPHWDAKLRELRVGKQLIKRFRCRAPNQEAILDAFEEEGWPQHIDDPLTQGQGHQDPKRRLNDTVKGLNRYRLGGMIQFAADGAGEGVRWTWVAPDLSTASNETDGPTHE